MRSRHLVIALALALAGCELPPPPPPLPPCVRWEVREELTPVYWPSSGSAGFGFTPAGPGFNVGGGMHLVPTTTEVCVERAAEAPKP